MESAFTSESGKSEAKRGPNRGIRNIALGALLIFVGPFALFVWLVISILSSGDSENRFFVPGEFEMLAEKPGVLTLWNCHAVIYDGKKYNADSSLPNGMEIAVFAEDDSQIEFVPREGISVNSGSEAKKSVGYVKVENPGFIRFLVSRDFEERVFSISELGLERSSVGCLSAYPSGRLR